MWQTITKGGEWRGKLRNRKKNGELFWEEATITPIFGPNREISHYLAVKEDVTERLEIEAQLRQAQKLEAIGQLAAGIAHEINTPAQFVTDNLQFIRDSWFAVSELIEKYRDLIGDCEANIPSSAKKSLSEIEQIADFKFISDEMPNAIEQGIEGARRIAKIVRAMKEFSHPDSADKVQIDFNQAIESTITVARNEWEICPPKSRRSLKKIFRLLSVTRGEINQVVLNLIVNAAHSIKEKPTWRWKGKITIRTREARGMMWKSLFRIQALGIPDAIRTRIFEPFFTTKEVGKGTGQGLAIGP